MKRFFQLSTFLFSGFHNLYVEFRIRALENILNKQSRKAVASNHCYSFWSFQLVKWRILILKWQCTAYLHKYNFIQWQIILFFFLNWEVIPISFHKQNYIWCWSFFVCFGDILYFCHFCVMELNKYANMTHDLHRKRRP